MIREDTIRATIEVLERTGFYLGSDEQLQNPIFDIIARRDSTLLLIKVLKNIDSFDEEKARILKSISKILDATPLIIGYNSCNRRLDNGVVYIRYGINIVSFDTFRDFLYMGIPPYVFSSPGGYYASINGEAMERIRKERGISLGEMARLLGVTARAVKMYESGMSASVDIAATIEDILGPEVITPLDIFRKVEDEYEIIPDERIVEMEGPLQREIHKIFYQRGFSYLPVPKCPFEALSKYDITRLVTGIDTRVRLSIIKRRAKIMSTISSITETYSVIITSRAPEGEIPSCMDGTPIIGKNELEDLEDATEILCFIKERSELE